MAHPPSYDDITASAKDEQEKTWVGDSKTLQRYSIRDEVGASRSQHVAALVSKLLPQIKERAKSGLSRTTLLLLPSDQAETSNKGELVGYPEDDRPILIQLEGRYDTTQFWTQDEALKVLREQTLVAVAGNIPMEVEEEPLPQIPVAEPVKSSWWGRKQSKAPEPLPPKPKPKPPPVTVHVQLEQVNFRSETEYGLYETVRGRAVLVLVEVR